MNLLYLIASQEVNPSVAAFIGRVSEMMDASLTILVTAEEAKRLKKLKAQVEALDALPVSSTERTLFVQDDPVTAMDAELANRDYTMVLLNVPRRRRVIPSPYRFLSQRIIKHASVPVMLVRNVSTKLERILACTAGSEISRPVVELSAMLASTAGLTTTLLTVSAAVPSMYTGMNWMDESLGNLLKTDTPVAQHLRQCAGVMTEHGIQADVKINHGDVVEGILEEAVKGDHDLIVLGETHGDTLRGMILGNVTQQIINRAPCAVLISKTPE